MKRCAATVLLALLITGCASAPKDTRRYFWPQLPERPRIEWLAAYNSQLDLPKVGAQKFLTSIAGDEDAVSFKRPVGIKSDGNGKVYVSDVELSAVLVYDFVNNDVHMLGRELSAGLFKWPLGIEVDSAGNIYVGDVEKGIISVFTADERPLRTIEVKEYVDRLGDFALDRSGRLVVVDSRNHRLQILSPEGKLLKTIGKRGTEAGEFNFPITVAINHKGEIIVGDSMNARIQIFAEDGTFLRKFGNRGDGPADFQLIKGVAVDSDDNIYVTEGKGSRMIVFNTAGEWLISVGGQYSSLVSGKVAPGGFLLPQGISIDRNDRIYVVDQLNKRFQVFQYMSDSFIAQHPIEGYSGTR